VIVDLKNSWAFPVIEAIHLCGVAIFVGSILFLDARRLNRGAETGSIAASERVLRPLLKPWTHAGLATILLTGAVMLASDWERYRHNPAVGVKLGLVALGLISYFAPRRNRFALMLSLALWTLVVLAAKAIADFDI